MTNTSAQRAAAMLAEDLLLQVLAGKKTATCMPLAKLTAAGTPIPEPGKRDVVLDGDGVPACTVETVAVMTCRFDEVTEEFARAEGEPSLDAWRIAQSRHFARNGGFTPAMKLVCEEFKVVEMLGVYKNT
ncbi:MAG: ASCH domain-containing protein [Burkholderiaceae bacterium]|nr:ASCH domain-containing protein [Burkholderiaceae bacterium]